VGEAVSGGDGRAGGIGPVAAPADDVSGATGDFLFPGAGDAHSHMRQPGLTHKEDWTTGSKAAAAGGVTLAFDMPNTRPSTTTLADLASKREEVGRSTLINFGLFFGANPENLDVCLEAEGTVALKIFMASSTGDLLVDEEEDLDRFFAAYERQISVHAESEERLLARVAAHAGATDPATHSVIRDPEAARLGVLMATKLANRYGRRLHVLHMSTKVEVDALTAARERAASESTGARITGEACPHHLFLTTDDYAKWGCFVQMNPPLRGEDDRQATWAALLDGRLDMVATDHAPHLPEEKQKGFGQAPSGVPGIQTMVPLLLDAAHRGVCTYEQVVEWVCHAPARIYGVLERSRIAVGHHADLAIIDPSLSREITDADQHSRCGWSPYAGRTTTGWPVRTLVNGVDVFVRDGDQDVFPAEYGVGREVEVG